MVARVEFEPATFLTQGTELTTVPSRSSVECTSLTGTFSVGGTVNPGQLLTPMLSNPRAACSPPAYFKWPARIP